ncbi:methyltransferase domain-containing protein [Cyanobium gracile]|nr:methyltransferase domain-containing protein [Cyanobium gracile]
MHWQPLGERNRQPEWMDQEGIDAPAHEQALKGLRRINALSGAVGCLFTPVEALAAALGPDRPLRILDVACGGGDNTITLAERCRRGGLAVQVNGCDRSEQAVAIASRHGAGTSVGSTFFQADVLVDPLPADYDIMVCTLFLHHLEDADAVALLRRLGQSSRHLVLVNDLIRSPLGYGLAWVGCRLLSRSAIVHFDGPVSVQGAFRMDEALDLAARAGLGGATIQHSWPERFLLSWRRPVRAVEAP